MYDLSICLTAIRDDNRLRLHDSIVESVGDYSFELIFCGPHEELPEELQGLDNVSCIQDLVLPPDASSVRC